jgi:hypothetical protein
MTRTSTGGSGMILSDPVLDECFRCWPAWQDLVERVMPDDCDARTVDPRAVFDVVEELSNQSVVRITYLLIANARADSLPEGAALLSRLLGLAENGLRPRYANEAGITLDDLERRL